MKDIIAILKELVPVWLLLMSIAYVYLLLLFYKLLNKTNELSEKQSKYLKDRVEVIEKTTGIYEKTFIQQEKSIEQLNAEKEKLKNELNEILPRLEEKIEKTVHKNSPNQNKDLTGKLYELLDIYQSVKSVILLAERETDKFLISPINELRNSLDHIMRSLSKDLNIDNEFNKASSHIIRAGIDSLEIIIITKMEKLSNLIDKYSRKTISQKFPDYYTSIFPLINKIKTELSSLRAKDLSAIENFQTYKVYTDKLIQYEELIYSKIPELEK